MKFKYFPNKVVRLLMRWFSTVGLKEYSNTFFFFNYESVAGVTGLLSIQKYGRVQNWLRTTALMGLITRAYTRGF